MKALINNIESYEDDLTEKNGQCISNALKDKLKEVGEMFEERYYTSYETFLEEKRMNDRKFKTITK